jgi:hypothetical protein
MFETLKGAFRLSESLGRIIAVLSILNLIRYALSIKLSVALSLLLKTYQEIFHTFLFNYALFWLPFDIPSYLKDFFVIYAICGGIVLRSVMRVDRMNAVMLFDKKDRLILDALNKADADLIIQQSGPNPSTGPRGHNYDKLPRINKIIFYFVLVLLWPLTVAMNYNKVITSAYGIKSIISLNYLNNIKWSAGAKGGADFVFKNIVAKEIMIVFFAVIILLGVNAGLAEPQSSDRPAQGLVPTRFGSPNSGQDKLSLTINIQKKLQELGCLHDFKPGYWGQQTVEAAWSFNRASKGTYIITDKATAESWSTLTKFSTPVCLQAEKRNSKR